MDVKRHLDLGQRLAISSDSTCATRELEIELKCTTGRQRPSPTETESCVRLHAGDPLAVAAGIVN